MYVIPHINKDNTSTSFKGWYEHWKKAPCLTQSSTNLLGMVSFFSDGRLQYFCWKCARVKSNTIVHIYISIKNHTCLTWKKWHNRWRTIGVKQGRGWKRPLSLSYATGSLHQWQNYGLKGRSQWPRDRSLIHIRVSWFVMRSTVQVVSLTMPKERYFYYFWTEA